MGNETNLSGLNPKNFKSEIGGKKTDLFVLRNKNGLEICVTNYGAMILSIMTPDRLGRYENIVIGCDTLEDAIILSKEYYIGTTIGPVSGRILNGKINISGNKNQLPINSISSTLHSGKSGFHTVVWDAEQITKNKLELFHLHIDNSDDFPGNIKVKMIYTLTDDNAFTIEYMAVTDKCTLFSPTNHSYFNLSGIGHPTPSIEDHIVTINAGYYLPIDIKTNNTGEILMVEDTPFDFRKPHTIGERLGRCHPQLLNGHGYDHCFVLEKDYENELSHAVSCFSPKSGRKLDVFTNEPGIIMYSGNYLSGFKGMHNTTFPRRSAVCFETGHFPDTPANLHFPSILLVPDSLYKQTCIYKFSTQL